MYATHWGAQNVCIRIKTTIWVVSAKRASGRQLAVNAERNWAEHNAGLWQCECCTKHNSVSVLYVYVCCAGLNATQFMPALFSGVIPSAIVNVIVWENGRGQRAIVIEGRAIGLSTARRRSGGPRPSMADRDELTLRRGLKWGPGTAPLKTVIKNDLTAR